MNMENRKIKRDVVKMLLNKKNMEISDDELMEILFENNIAVDVIKENDKNMSIGDKIADKITTFTGSWGFILGFIIFILIWMFLNLTILKDVDPYPFILLNLLLSCIAAIQAPIIMMSQNRSSKKDSLRSQNDYKTDLKSEILLEELHLQIEKIEKLEKEIIKLLSNKEDNN